jgi:hypothetical protein
VRFGLDLRVVTDLGDFLVAFSVLLRSFEGYQAFMPPWVVPGCDCSRVLFFSLHLEARPADLVWGPIGLFLWLY